MVFWRRSKLLGAMVGFVRSLREERGPFRDCSISVKHGEDELSSVFVVGARPLGLT